MQLSKINKNSNFISFSSNKKEVAPCKNSNIVFRQEDKNPFDEAKKDFPNAVNTDFAAALSIGCASMSVIETSAHKMQLKKIPLFLLGMAILVTGGLYFDSLIGNKIKQSFKDNEEKAKKVQLGYDVGISAIMFPATLALMDKTNIHKIKLLDNAFLKKHNLSQNKMLGILAGVGMVIGAAISGCGKKINSWIAQNLMGYKKEEN